MSPSRNKNRNYKGVSRDQIVGLKDKAVDIRPLHRKIFDSFAYSPLYFNILISVLFICIIVLPFTMDFMLFLSAIFTAFIITVGKKEKLLFRTPISSGALNRDNKKYYDKNGKEIDGMFFFGNDIEFNNAELWFSDSDVRKHMLLFGTTGAGKTEALLSLTYVALLACSGFIYSDGKGTFELFHKIFNTCRTLGQEDNLLLMSFLTGKEDLRFATTIRISNTCNPFSYATQDASVQLLVSLMASGGSDPMWKERAASLMEAVMGVLVYRRDYQKRLISIQTIADTLILNNIYNIWANAKKVPENEKDNPDYLPMDIVLALKNYLVSLPGFEESKPFDKQSETINEQHGYLQMQFSKLLGSLANMYGYIFNTQLSEINFWDVVVNRRALVVLLPALAKSKTELSMLGKIVISCIKQMMSTGLGKTSEGNLREILLANPTASRTPFFTILDEYGYYAVEGAAVIPAQARGLGFFMIFAGQDFPAFAATSKEEAESIVANCKIQCCMALQDAKETFEIFLKKGGQVEVAVSSGKEWTDTTTIINSRGIVYEKRDLIEYEDLTKQESGEAHIMFEGKLARGRFYYVGISSSEGNARVNQFIKVTPPEIEAAEEILKGFNDIKERITNIQYITNLMDDEDDENQEQVINDISKLFNIYKKEHNGSSTLSACATIAHVLYNKHKILEQEKEKRNIISESNFQTAFVHTDKAFDIKKEMYEKDKNDYSKQEIDIYGINASAMEENLMKKQMMISENIAASEADVKKTIDGLNNTVAYPKAIPEIKSVKNISNIINELNKEYAQIIDEVNDEMPY